MLPHEVQAIMAKIIFFIFALLMFAVGKARSEAINDLALGVVSPIVSTEEFIMKICK